jgi:hypothetical protein
VSGFLGGMQSTLYSTPGTAAGYSSSTSYTADLNLQKKRMNLKKKKKTTKLS